jgi:hypothetical protein
VVPILSRSICLSMPRLTAQAVTLRTYCKGWWANRRVSSVSSSENRRLGRYVSGPKRQEVSMAGNDTLSI